MLLIRDADDEPIISKQEPQDESKVQPEQLIKLIYKQDYADIKSWVDNHVESENSILNEYDKNNESTPIHIACWENNVEILNLLLQCNPNVNLLNEPNNRKYTTMHIAAIKENVTMMKLLIQRGFNCDKFINNIYYDQEHRSVFLQLCCNGNVECMDYLMNHDQCKSKIDIWQRDINGYNGLHSAVTNQHVSMVKYLLNKVYKKDELKRKVFDHTVGINGTHISVLAAETGITQDGLSIFKLLRQNDCMMYSDVILHAAAYSSLILEYMLNERLYPNYIYLTKELIIYTLANARVNLVHKNVLIIVKYLSTMKDHDDYKKWIINIFYDIMTYGTMDGYFLMFKEVIEILSNNCNDCKSCTKNKIIDKGLLIETQEKINNPSNMQDVADDKWCLLLQTMIDSFDDKTSPKKYDDNGNEEKNENDYWRCNQNHLMNKMNNDSNTGLLSPKKCSYCARLQDTSLLSFECVKCREYTCNQCFSCMDKLIQVLKNEEFHQFNQVLYRYTKTTQENMIKNS